MKTIINSLIVMLLLAGCTSLDEEVYSDLSPNNFYVSEADADAAVIAIYNGLNRRPFHDTYFTSLTFMPAPHSASRLPNRRMFANYSFDASNFQIIEPYWSAVYDMINRANTAIDRIPDIDMDETLKKRLIAEAKWLRAYNYFNLVRLFGDVPLYLKETTSLEDVNQPRAPMSEVYAAIIEDLKEADENLPPNRTDDKKGRVTRGTARFLLAKVYLTMAGEPMNDGSGLEEARTLLVSLYENKGAYGYDLLDNYADIFKLDNELNAEIVFAVQQSRAVGGQGTGMAHIWGPLRSPFGGTGQYHGGCTQEFYQSYDSTDVRRDVTWLERYTARGTNQVFVFGSGNGPYGDPRNGMAQAKYQDPEMNFVDGETDIIIYRFSDVILMLAEIENELNGPNATAFDYLNEVRERAHAGTYDQQAAATPEEFRELIYKERFWEFSFEFHEVFDIRRMGKLKEAIETGFETKLFGTSYDPKYELYPIPLSEIQTNPNIAGHQNPGW
ncbi:RagB/SusD family nutrient uptake outer membrane protein [Sinomicrobium weinanense]|uniref:RagB/SusD family nutrient uptake outer membrane protein n=1 Tax=Sinomicrobium weinanense TaxID=2842200 RepID=A0A926JQQ4_9FLAO|nr:RagB/SusD family nutrient uptake outer membrane protein [Sinomicrobium weinanense]MBC9795740.1 RagB/SusD family nutrient uptake outer membrane protein [Sinomicrobium weinanense]MBU3125303.1 RagB/SusD family nutrient uptake outer membrane protein [Sinomicrobium weinanense]